MNTYTKLLCDVFGVSTEKELDKVIKDTNFKLSKEQVNDIIRCALED